MSVPRLQHVESGEWLDIGLGAGAEGGALHTAGNGDSSFRTVIGDPLLDVGVTGFPGVHGVLAELYGTRGRPIVWEGELRVAQAALSAILSTRDQWRLREGQLLFVDHDDVEYPSCRLVQFEIGMKQRLQSAGTLYWWVPYSIVLEQMEI